MQVFPIIFFWKLIFSIKFIQCEVNSTKLSIFLRSYQNSQLTAQEAYDLRDSLRKSNQFIDYLDADDDEQEDYIISDEIEFSNSLVTSTTSATSNSIMLKSSSRKIHLKFVYLVLLLVIQKIQ